MKRKRVKKDASGNVKRLKTDSDVAITDNNLQSTPTILRLYYPQVLTLREYLVQVASNSKTKKRRIVNYGINLARSSQNDDAELAKLLDTVLVGCHSLKEDQDALDYRNELNIFATQVSVSTCRSDLSQSGLSLAEVGLFDLVFVSTVWPLLSPHLSKSYIVIRKWTDFLPNRLWISPYGNCSANTLLDTGQIMFFAMVTFTLPLVMSGCWNEQRTLLPTELAC